MIKQKLINKRTDKNITQEDMAFPLGMSQSQYCRRENGTTKISKKEWNKIANILETSLEEIYESEDGVYIINDNNHNDNNSEKHNHCHQIPDYILETMKKYIEKLESELEDLKINLRE